MFFRRLSLVGFSALFMAAESLSFSQEKINQNCIIAKSGEEISSVAWSQDGKFFASAWNNNVVLWDSESGKIKEIYREHTKAVKKVNFSKGGNRLLSLGQDNIVVMRDITSSSGTIRAVGTDLQPMNDAVFAGDNTSVILPGDGGSATLYFPLRLTNQFISKKLLKTDSVITSFDLSYDGSMLLCGTQEGKAYLLNINDGSGEKIFSFYTASGIHPRISPDGKFIFYPVDNQRLEVSSTDGSKSFTIEDSDFPVKAASFSSDGTLIAYAVKNGGIKIFNLKSKSFHHFFIIPSSHAHANSIAFSPNSKKMLAGTEKGLLLCWNISDNTRAIKNQQAPEEVIKSQNDMVKNDASPITDILLNQTSEESGESLSAPEGESEEISSNKTETEIQNLKNALEVSLLVTSLNEDYYHSSFGLSAAWKSYKRLPFCYGAGAEFSFAPPANDYPYTTSYDGIELNNPWLYRAHIYAQAGLGHYIKEYNLLFFCEGRLGFGGNILFNNELTYRRTSKPTFCFLADALAGIQWKALNIYAGSEFDSNLGFIVKAGAGVVIHLGN